jgi:hypothetical protein
MQQRTRAAQPRWSLWCGALTLAFCGTAWLYAALPGINWSIATLAVSVGLVACWASAGKKQRLDVLLPLVVACLISVGAALTADRANDITIAAAVLFALGSAVVAASNRGSLPDEPVSWVVAAPYAVVLTTSEARGRFAETCEALRSSRGRGVMRGMTLAVPITLSFAVLLSEADPTFAAGRDLIVRLLQEFSILPRGLFFVVLSVCLVGALGIALRTTPEQAPRSRVPRMPRQIFADTERLIVLGSVAALFALFLTLQLSYLFGDPGGRAGSGVSYADAVHRGFTELNVASTACAALLFALRRYAVSRPPSRWLSALEWIVTLQCQILLWSAFHRVNLYEAAYGFTKLRLFVQAYAVVACIALILLLIELAGHPRLDRFLRRVMVVAALALAGLVWGDSATWLARANLLRYARTGQIDLQYLTNGLGPDAVPVLVAELPRLPSTLAARTAVCLRNRYPDQPADGHWYEWSLRRAALNRALAQIRAREARR